MGTTTERGWSPDWVAFVPGCDVRVRGAGGFYTGDYRLERRDGVRLELAPVRTTGARSVVLVATVDGWVLETEHGDVGPVQVETGL